MSQRTTYMPEAWWILLVCFVLGLTSCGGGYGQGEYERFRNQCVIDNRTLPRPDLYCNALWQQQQENKGGR